MQDPESSPESLFSSFEETGGQFEVLAPSLLPPGWEAWDRFQILTLLGEGGMGRVFKALDTTLKRTVALKFLRFDDPGLARRLSLEAQIQAGLDHENFVKVFETGEFKGSPYIAMQYIEGQTLDRLPKLGLQERVALLVQVARALHAAHAQGLVHRDLKPSNILVERQGNRPKPYLMDFGLASFRDTSAPTTKVMGTLAYMAPEQARLHLANAAQALRAAFVIARSDAQCLLDLSKVEDEWIFLSHYLPDADAAQAFQRGQYQRGQDWVAQAKRMDPGDGRVWQREAGHSGRNPQSAESAVASVSWRSAMNL